MAILVLRCHNSCCSLKLKIARYSYSPLIEKAPLVIYPSLNSTFWLSLFSFSRSYVQNARQFHNIHSNRVRVPNRKQPYITIRSRPLLYEIRTFYPLFECDSLRFICTLQALSALICTVAAKERNRRKHWKHWLPLKWQRLRILPESLVFG